VVVVGMVSSQCRGLVSPGPTLARSAAIRRITTHTHNAPPDCIQVNLYGGGLATGA
jgi:hypothetical protein